MVSELRRRVLWFRSHLALARSFRWIQRHWDPCALPSWRRLCPIQDCSSTVDRLVHNTHTHLFPSSSHFPQSESRSPPTPTPTHLTTSTPLTVVTNLPFPTSKDRAARGASLSTLLLWDFPGSPMGPMLPCNLSRTVPMAGSTRWDEFFFSSSLPRPSSSFSYAV